MRTELVLVSDCGDASQRLERPYRSAAAIGGLLHANDPGAGAMRIVPADSRFHLLRREDTALALNHVQHHA